MIPSPGFIEEQMETQECQARGQTAVSVAAGNPERVGFTPLHLHAPRWAATLSDGLGHIISHPKSDPVSTVKKSHS